MTRMLAAVLALLATAAAAQAHFVYVVPASDGRSVQVVFSDNLEPDPRIKAETFAATTLVAVDGAGKDTPLKLTKGAHALTAPLPGRGVAVIVGVTDMGIVQSKFTQNRPVWNKTYPKAHLENLAVVGKATPAGDRVPLEIVPAVQDGQLTFRVLHKGKPLAGSEVGVLVPGEKSGRPATMTDADGRVKEGFDKPGWYAVRARFVEAAPGVREGKKYEEVRHTATLVVEFTPRR